MVTIIHQSQPSVCKRALGGGYIFDVNTTIDYGVKHENVLAMFDAVKTYGKY